MATSNNLMFEFSFVGLIDLDRCINYIRIRPYSVVIMCCWMKQV